MKLMSRFGLVAALAVTASSSFAQLFVDPCESLSSYQVLQAPDLDNSATVIDYSNFTLNDALGMPVTWNIAEAPRQVSGSGATTGFLLRANKNDLVAALSGINLIVAPGGTPLEVNASCYHMACDVYMKSDVPTGVGTTEAFDMGVSRLGNSTSFGYWNRTTQGDGNWWTMVPEGGLAGNDFRLYKNTVAAGGRDVSSPVCQAVFPGTSYDYAGAPSGNWTKMDLYIFKNRFVMVMNDTIFWRNTTTPTTNGKVWVGYCDAFAGIAGAPEKQFAIVDNISVDERGFFSGSLSLSGYAGPDITQEPFDVTIKDSAGTVVEQFTTNVDASGNFSFGTPIDQNVTVIIDNKSSVNRHFVGVSATTAGTNLGSMVLLNGDITSDGIIDIADYTVLATKFDASNADPDWNTAGTDGFMPSQADLTRDGIVDIADYTQLALNFDAVSEEP